MPDVVIPVQSYALDLMRGKIRSGEFILTFPQ
jgi:hypothetical protein